MVMKIIYNSVIPFKGFMAINLFGTLFVRNEYKGKVDDVVLNHENIHTEQMKELGYIQFYIIYFIEWLIRLITNPDNPYRNISFEQEAYNNEKNLDYIKTRKKFSWKQYMKK